jgi:undecaprenyl-diphosphatase
MEAFNQALFLSINATPNLPHWLIVVGLIVANDLIWVVPVTLVGLWLAGGDERREVALRAALVAAVALGINQLIALIEYHPRPFVIGLGHTFLAHAPDSSFPSDHVTLLSAVVCTFLYNKQRLLGLSGLGIAIAVAWGRIFVGVHYPFDMAGAACVGWVTYVLMTPLWRAFGPNVSRICIAVYRRVLARPIGQGWLRA